MVRKAASVHKLCLLAMLLCGAFSIAQTGSAPPQNAFDEKAASQMLLQMSEALEGHSQKQFLALFDLQKMKDGELFKDQVASFYAQTESIRIHMNLAELTANGAQATFSVEAEMETEPTNSGPMSRRNERITFTVTSFTASNNHNWKIIEVQPRSFFSLP